MPKVAIVAAMEREVRAAIRNWRVSEREYDGRRYRFFENGRAVLVCAGIGSEAARRACVAMLALYRPSAVCSVGFAGAIDESLKAGTPFTAHRVVDAADGSHYETGWPGGTLVSFGAICGVEQKAKLGKAYGAQAVDMEAAAVARVAHAHGLPFLAQKAISDEHDFELPGLEKFSTHDGRFRAGAFVMFAAIRPWLWGKVLRLRRNSARAASALCDWLERYNQPVPNVGADEAGIYSAAPRRY